MLKRLWLILGPVFCALLMVTALLFFYPINHKHNYTEEKKAAVSLNAEGFKSRTKKQEALSDPQHRFVPYFGSSEWLRFDVVHPAVLAEKYDRNYRPYFLGERGAASLNQYFGMQQILPELKDNTAVYVVSPQWFTKKGYDSSAFQQFFNSDQLNSFIANHQQDAASQYAAKRLLQQYPNVAFQSVVTKISQGKKISRFDQSLNQFVPTLSSAKMLCLVILQRVQTGITIRRSKNVYKIYQINSHMRNWKKLQRLKQKSKPITTTLESAIIFTILV